MELDLEIETEKLRKRSPMGSRRILFTVVGTILLTLLLAGIGLSIPEVRYNENWWVPVIFPLTVFVMGALFTFAFRREAKILIDTGEVVEARPLSIVALPKGANRLTVEYDQDDQTYQKSFTMIDFNCQTIEKNRVLNDCCFTVIEHCRAFVHVRPKCT